MVKLLDEARRDVRGVVLVALPGLGAECARPGAFELFRNCFCSIALACCALVSTFDASAGSDADCRGRGPKNPDCGTHNMMLVGEKAVYLSHLPMFMAPHQFQVILEAAFEKGGKPVSASYLGDRAQHPKVKMYTVEPAEVFVLTRMWAAEGRRRTEFGGTVFRGHLERGGEQISGLVATNVKVKRVIYARELPTAKRDEKLTYIVFGDGKELFAAHQLSQAPDFDQIVSIEVEGHTLTPAELARGVTVMIIGRDNLAASRIKEGETTTGQGQVTGASQLFDIRVRAKRELYFEEGELLTEPRFDPTEEEKKAGF